MPIRVVLLGVYGAFIFLPAAMIMMALQPLKEELSQRKTPIDPFLYAIVYLIGLPFAILTGGLPPGSGPTNF